MPVWQVGNAFLVLFIFQNRVCEAPACPLKFRRTANRILVGCEACRLPVPEKIVLAPQLNALRASSSSYSTGQAGNFVAHPGETRYAETKVCFTGRAGGFAAHGRGVRLKSTLGGDYWNPLNGYIYFKKAL